MWIPVVGLVVEVPWMGCGFPWFVASAVGSCDLAVGLAADSRGIGFGSGWFGH